MSAFAANVVGVPARQGTGALRVNTPTSEVMVTLLAATECLASGMSDVWRFL